MLQTAFIDDVDPVAQKYPAEHGCCVDEVEDVGHPYPAAHGPLTADNPVLAQKEPKQQTNTKIATKLFIWASL
jgi:hypothetical protein